MVVDVVYLDVLVARDAPVTTSGDTPIQESFPRLDKSTISEKFVGFPARRLFTAH